MGREPVWLVGLLLSVGWCQAAVGEWSTGEVAYRFEAGARTLSATCAGRTWQALSGLGPRFLWGGQERPDAEVRVTLLAADERDGRLVCTYRATCGSEAETFTLSLGVTAGALTVIVQSPSRRCARVSAGRCVGWPRWHRFGYTRHAEPYGQQFWPMVAALAAEPPLYAAATWDMAASNGTTWSAPDQRTRGEGDFAAALDVTYSPNAAGVRDPVDETLTLRVSRDLWPTIPPPTQRPSEYAAELAQSVFVDVWGGSAVDTEYFLAHLAALTGGRQRFYTILQNWQAGGFDALLPDSIVMPDYPPNPGIGSVDELRRLSAAGRRLGRFGLRTNYLLLRNAAPSVKAGRARPATGADGKPAWFTRPADWLPLGRRQETEIARLFDTNANFSDQYGSGGAPWAYTDAAGSVAMRHSQQQQREFLRYLKDAHRGPLGTETLIDETQLGEFMDTGDFGIFDGYHRAFTPEFKLRRIHHLTCVHGLGLMYRYFEMPPFKLFSSGQSPCLSAPEFWDDYRAAEVLYGNGGYLFYYPGMRWDYVATECVLIGTLQRWWALQPVRAVRYWHEGGWRSLPEIVAAGVNPLPDPWAPGANPPCLRRIRVEYANGLQVVVNRLPEEFTVAAGSQNVVLPKSGWVAWTADGRVLAWSAYQPGTRHRVDYLLDRDAGLTYLDPRGAEVNGETRPTIRRGQSVTRLDPATGELTIDGVARRHEPPGARPVTRLDFRFATSLHGWSPQSCFGRIALRNGALEAEITGEDPYLCGPVLDLAPDTVKEVVVRMSLTCGTFGQLYFITERAKTWSEERCLHFKVQPDGQLHDVRIKVADHPQWRGQRITGLRLDPEHGAAPGVVRVERVWGE